MSAFSEKPKTGAPDARAVYGDIIDHDHYVDPDRPRMSRMNRAAQFSPFAALTGYEDLIDEAARYTDERTELDDSVKEALGRRLRELLRTEPPPVVTVVFFVPDGRKSGGAYRTVSGRLLGYDAHARTILLEPGGEIPLDDVTDLSAEHTLRD